MILNLIFNVSKNFFIFFNHVNVIFDIVFFQIEVIKVIIEIMLRNQSIIYYLSNKNKRKITF